MSHQQNTCWEVDYSLRCNFLFLNRFDPKIWHHPLTFYSLFPFKIENCVQINQIVKYCLITTHTPWCVFMSPSQKNRVADLIFHVSRISIVAIRHSKFCSTFAKSFFHSCATQWHHSVRACFSLFVCTIRGVFAFCVPVHCLTRRLWESLFGDRKNLVACNASSLCEWLCISESELLHIHCANEIYCGAGTLRQWSGIAVADLLTENAHLQSHTNYYSFF